MYQIYINHTVLIITDDAENGLSDDQQIDSEGFQFSAFYQRFKDSPVPGTYMLVTQYPKELFKQIRQSLRYIKAAGGLVSNEENKYLFIFRNGKWDLPKGKIDGREKTRVAAVREVEEECGIKVSSLENQIGNTYHIYEMNGEVILKKTTWYRMRAEKQAQLTPQLEEGITDARWLAPEEFIMVKQNTYPLIKEIVEKIEL